MRPAPTFPTVLLVTAFALACDAPDAEPAHAEREVKASFPAGDEASGREAFVALRCHACHEVKGDPGVPELTAVDAGPALGPALGRLSQGELVSAIVVPSHSVMDLGVEPAGGELSRMGDFTEVMTVRQLVDIVSYLEQIARP
jgi:mono/diheme cytochrome c family protein